MTRWRRFIRMPCARSFRPRRGFWNSGIGGDDQGRPGNFLERRRSSRSVAMEGLCRPRWRRWWQKVGQSTNADLRASLAAGRERRCFHGSAMPKPTSTKSCVCNSLVN
jgi:hypothetical protein